LRFYWGFIDTVVLASRVILGTVVNALEDIGTGGDVLLYAHRIDTIETSFALSTIPATPIVSAFFPRAVWCTKALARSAAIVIWSTLPAGSTKTIAAANLVLAGVDALEFTGAFEWFFTLPATSPTPIIAAHLLLAIRDALALSSLAHGTHFTNPAVASTPVLTALLFITIGLANTNTVVRAQAALGALSTALPAPIVATLLPVAVSIALAISFDTLTGPSTFTTVSLAAIVAAFLPVAIRNANREAQSLRTLLFLLALPAFPAASIVSAHRATTNRKAPLHAKSLLANESAVAVTTGSPASVRATLSPSACGNTAIGRLAPVVFVARESLGTIGALAAA